MAWFWRRREAGRHGLGAAVTSIPSGPLVVSVSAPVPPPVPVDPEVSAALARAQAEAALLPALPLDEVARVLGVDLPVATNDAGVVPAPQHVAVDHRPVAPLPDLQPVVDSARPAALGTTLPSETAAAPLAEPVARPTALPAQPSAAPAIAPYTSVAAPRSAPSAVLPADVVPCPPSGAAGIAPIAVFPASQQRVEPALEPFFVEVPAVPFVATQQPEQPEPVSRVQLGFRDGSTSGVDDADQARALEELARALTSSG